MLTWIVAVEKLSVEVNHKSFARELTRQLGVGVFWERGGQIDEDERFVSNNGDRAIFVGDSPGIPARGYTPIKQADPLILQRAAIAADTPDTDALLDLLRHWNYFVNQETPPAVLN